ncbi:transporter YfdV [Escherichia coli]|nr:transporter YfdV [Escherichia coli]SQZ59374.1 transporter YfdV [Escherichia coli]SRY94020.1 transporter YfdV [Escherichia coli]
MLTFFIGDLLPIIVIMLLGYFSGRRETFSEDQARAFNKLVLNYALPAALFVSITRANREMIFADTRLTLVSLGNDSNLLIVFYVQIMPDDFVMQLHRF